MPIDVIQIGGAAEHGEHGNGLHEDQRVAVEEQAQHPDWRRFLFCGEWCVRVVRRRIGSGGADGSAYTAQTRLAR